MNPTIQQERFKPRRSDIEGALGRVLTGSSFRSSAQCSALLRYIIEHTLSHQSEMLRERIIAINVFGRPPDYDSGNDPIVRARAAEVRKRLAQHYLHGEGASEEMLIEIPLGSYRAIFATRNPIESNDLIRRTGLSEGYPLGSANQAGDMREPLGEADDKGSIGSPISGIGRANPSRLRWIDGGFKPVLVAITSIGLVIGVVGFFLGHFSRAPIQKLHGSPPLSDDPVASFWAPFLQEDHSPIIAYSDDMFLVDGPGDFFRFRHGASDNRGVSVDPHLAREFASSPALVASAGPLFYDNGYTGTGDLRAIALLVAELARQGATPIIESSFDISSDELKQHNVILLGSSAENLGVVQLVPAGSFLIVSPLSKQDPWSGKILNSLPNSGEQSKYATLRDPVTHGVQQDYALISFQPGVTPKHQIAILSGIDTTGTEGAALLVTSRAGVEELSNALGQVNTASQTGKDRAFQAIARVDVKKGYQVIGSHLATMHSFIQPKPVVATGPSSN